MCIPHFSFRHIIWKMYKGEIIEFDRFIQFDNILKHMQSSFMRNHIYLISTEGEYS